MAENYPQFLSSVMAKAEVHAAMSSEELNHPFLTAPHLPINTAPVNYQSFGQFSGYTGPSFAFQPSVSKGRRKSATAAATDAEQVKHRRTRSGCFTCRGRRVKCDEARPICDRCRKGGRDCVYPDPLAAKGSTKQKGTTTISASNRTPSPSNSEDAEHDGSKAPPSLHTIPDEDEDENDQGKTSAENRPKSNLVLRLSDQTAFDSHSTSPSPSTTATGDPFSPVSNSFDFRSILMEEPNLSKLPKDYQMHLQYLYENVTCHHYCLSNDTDNFFVPSMIIEASRNRLLLNAVVAFAAYLRSVRHPDGKLRDFLLYYNRSITLLLECLKQEETHNLPTLLSILQLATIEEYLGDWLNLVGHQRAALELFTKLFTPETFMETPISRICFSWYARFDGAMALIGGTRSNFSRDWYTGALSYYQERINHEPGEIRWRLEERLTRLGVIRYDMSTLLSDAATPGEVSEMEFSQKHDKITIQLMDWRDSWDPMLTAPNYVVPEHSWQPPKDPDDIVDPCEPGLLYRPPLLSSTIISMEWHSLIVLHKSLAKTVPREKLASDLLRHSYAVCQLFEALEYWPSTPKGVLLGLKLCLGLAALFLPRDERHRKWLWRKFALLETMGSVATLPFRSKMAQLFDDAGAEWWWLPDDEGLSATLQSIRNFADERHDNAVHLVSRQAIDTLLDKLAFGLNLGQ